ncbi:T9SS C-terminal target domain-containing protein [Flavipsychrobacter stenotrophus]|uniref:T9SS C-terminal target domain-containing protein n=1 Tax=Flavipsychrobacter stenotrophus TaxID=2077091 RepID=A0A2S7SUN4_9BACT|nr:T9SS type A sorting domain-containing protein [Flavipsychrobacter stenotrophus]PQJ10454.1 T9SS C-terminal target domain-containing protein [Flavipsychrobacter stenotrophus]
MRKLILIIAMICAWGDAQAQINLVHNPSFETHWRCPQYHDLVKYANYWSAIEDTVRSSIDTLGTPPYLTDCKPEYCNTCSSYPVTKVPDGQAYTHYPKSGNGMMQMQNYYNELDTTSFFKRDYLQGKLINRLAAGQQYCVTFYAVLTGASAYAHNGLGAYLDDGTIDTTTNCGVPQSTHTPQVFETAIITDTVIWTKVQGSFTATGNESFITIGNFFDANHTDTLRKHFSHASVLGNDRYSWHLVDDVSVIKIGTVANAGNDTTIYSGDTAWLGEHISYAGDSVWTIDNDDYTPCKWYTTTGVLVDSNHSGLHVHPTVTTSYVMELDVCGVITYDTVTVHVHGVGIDGTGSMANVKIYPNPAADEVYVSGAAPGSAYRLVNAVGVVVKSGVPYGRIDLRGLASGVYVLEVVGDDGSRGVFRLVH